MCTPLKSAFELKLKAMAAGLVDFEAEIKHLPKEREY
jgi:hypothetical protein